MGSHITTEPTWQELGAAHRALQHSRIPKDWILNEQLLDELSGGEQGRTQGFDLVATQAAQRANILTAKELDITESHTAVELLSKLDKGELTSLEVTTAFCKRAAIAQQLVSANHICSPYGAHTDSPVWCRRHA